MQTFRGQSRPLVLGAVSESMNPLPSSPPVRDDFTKVNVKFSCWEQSGFTGVCGQAFMFETPEEVSAGTCMCSP